MPDIFNRQSDRFGGSFAADQVVVSFPRLLDQASGQAIGADVGLLLQRLSLSYTQQVTRLFEIGSPAIYYVGGRCNGDAGIDRVVGPRAIASAFYSTYGDICQARSNTLSFSILNGCGEAGTPQSSTGINQGLVAYECHFCVVTTVGINIGAQDVVINESVRIMFSSLVYSTGGA